MRRLEGLAAVAVAALVVAGCATMSVSSHVERGIDFAQYRTYDWGPADALPTGDPRLDRNPFFQEHVRRAVEGQLAASGLERTTSGTPDLLIHYHASIARRIYASHGYDEDGRVRVIEYDAGTLVLDIADTRTNRVIWRGWAQDGVKALDDEDRMARKIDEAVTRMLARLPRRF
jgi:hypothetical protein